jgi:hypothetical protein
MSDAGVQTFLGDCMERRTLQLLLLHEDGRRYSVLRVATHFREAKRLRALMGHARPYGEGIKALAGLTLELADTRPVPSLVENQQVNDALVASTATLRRPTNCRPSTVTRLRFPRPSASFRLSRQATAACPIGSRCTHAATGATTWW